jgi:hypothetical protein
MFDICSVTALSQGGNQFWLLVMDDYTISFSYWSWMTIQTIVGVSSFLIRMTCLKLLCNGFDKSPPNIRLKLNALGVIMLVKVSNHC